VVPAPRQIDGAAVLLFTPIDRRHGWTGRCLHTVSGSAGGPTEGLAICRYEGETGFYLFGCGAGWECQTDTLHGTIEEAMAQAEFEYEGVSATWQKPNDAVPGRLA
jgi:hypothetical protein